MKIPGFAYIAIVLVAATGGLMIGRETAPSDIAAFATPAPLVFHTPAPTPKPKPPASFAVVLQRAKGVCGSIGMRFESLVLNGEHKHIGCDNEDFRETYIDLPPAMMQP